MLWPCIIPSKWSVMNEQNKPPEKGIHSSYKQEAKKGCDLLFRVTIKGRKKLVDDIPLHMSLKIFKSRDEVRFDDLFNYVKEHNIDTPSTQGLTFKPIIFTSESTKLQYYMLIIEGLDPKYKSLYNHYKNVGNVYKKFMTHVTIDKALYDDIKANGLKPDEIEFGPLMLEHGANNAVHTFYKSETLGGPEYTRKSPMQITPNEIDTIEDAGEMDNSPVKLIRTKGGFWIAVGRKRGQLKEEALAAGSHPAIVRFNLEKQYPDFHPTLAKSENLEIPSVAAKHSHFLSEDLRKSGHDLYSVQTGPNIEFQITKHNVKISSVQGTLENDAIVIGKANAPKEFARALTMASLEKAKSCGADKVKFQGK